MGRDLSLVIEIMKPGFIFYINLLDKLAGKDNFYKAFY